MKTQENPNLHHSQLAILVATLGIVYGDIGTSPLYALKNCFSLYQLPVNQINVLGIISLIFWSLFTVVSFKYIRLVLKADHHGQGGILALWTRCARFGSNRTQRFILFLGLLGAALFYGDGVITPAISVVGALEGLEVISKGNTDFIPFFASAILSALFLFQRKGSQVIGSWFGPVMVIWFSVLTLLGLYQIFKHPPILFALNPYYCFLFIYHNGLASLLTFGAIVLVVTGVEALYADLGHFSYKSIKKTWMYFVFPALTVNYFGQGALVLMSPETITNPFFMMAPQWALYPLLILATLATIIASQAVISGIFSISWQAMRLEFFPRMRVIHTSSLQMGQVYLPVINYLLLAATLLTVVIFKTTEHMTAAYGIAITGIMLITSILTMMLAHYAWKWSVFKIAFVFSPFLILDLLFFSTNMIKFPKGGWYPILIALMIGYLIKAWKTGRDALMLERSALKEDLGPYIKEALQKYPTRIPGTAIFMCRSTDKVPSTLDIHVKHNKFLHEQLIFLSIVTMTIPEVPKENRVEVLDYGDNIIHVTANFGYTEIPDLGFILNLVKKEGVVLNRQEATFFLSRGVPVASDDMYMSGLQEKLFIFLSHNAVNATDYYQIPYEQVVEYGVRFGI